MNRLLSTLSVVLSVLVLYSAPLSAKEKKVSVPASFQEKLKSYLQILDTDQKRISPYLEKKDTFQKISEAYFKYYTEEDLAGFLQFLNSDNGKKFLKFEQKAYQNMNDVIYADSTPKPSKSKKSKSKKSNVDYGYGDYDRCEYELKMVKDDVKKGLSRFKRICGIDNFPDNLDSAQDGEGDYDNTFFTRVSQYGRTTDWSKKGNTYTYTCDGKKKVFTYDSKDGSFEMK